MNRLIVISLAIALSMFCGCLCITRIPLPSNEMYSDEGFCTNRTWECIYDQHPKWRVYPTIKMRGKIIGEWWKDIDPDLKGERLYKARMFKYWGWFPISIICLTAPIDTAVDTVFLPWDIYCLSDNGEN